MIGANDVTHRMPPTRSVRHLPRRYADCVRPAPRSSWAPVPTWAPSSRSSSRCAGWRAGPPASWRRRRRSGWWSRAGARCRWATCSAPSSRRTRASCSARTTTTPRRRATRRPRWPYSHTVAPPWACGRRRRSARTLPPRGHPAGGPAAAEAAAEAGTEVTAAMPDGPTGPWALLKRRRRRRVPVRLAPQPSPRPRRTCCARPAAEAAAADLPNSAPPAFAEPPVRPRAPGLRSERAAGRKSKRSENAARVTRRRPVTGLIRSGNFQRSPTPRTPVSPDPRPFQALRASPALWSRDARSRDRLDRPLPHRPRLQGVAEGPAPGRPHRHDHPGRPRQGPASWTRATSTT